MGLLLFVNRLGIERLAVYAILAGLLWLAVLQSGIHATLAGVAAAMTIPARTQQAVGDGAGGHLRAPFEETLAPLERLEHGLHPWTAFAIVPIFALANAGVTIGDHLDAALRHPAVHGIVAGLVVGKQVGILGAAWLAVRSGLADLPEDLGWRHLWAAGWVAGIGFTMSLFIAELAFPGLPLVEVAKLGILAASIVAAAGGALVLLRLARRPRPAE